MYDSDLSATPGIEKSILAEREYFLSQLDDALETSRSNDSNTEIYSGHFSRSIRSDVGQYARLDS